MSTYPAAEYGFQNTRNRAVRSSICSIAKITGKTTEYRIALGRRRFSCKKGDELQNARYGVF